MCCHDLQSHQEIELEEFECFRRLAVRKDETAIPKPSQSMEVDKEIEEPEATAQSIAQPVANTNAETELEEAETATDSPSNRIICHLKKKLLEMPKDRLDIDISITICPDIAMQQLVPQRKLVKYAQTPS